MAQTAVEWLVNELPQVDWSDTHWVAKLNQAKQMEKEQIIKIYHEYQDYLDYEFINQQGGQGVILTFEQYYNETYNK